MSKEIESVIVKHPEECYLHRLPKDCSIYNYTTGKCDGCGHNLKQIRNIKN